MTTIRAAAYTRTSASERSGEGLEGQERQIREYAERNGYEIVAVYQDTAPGSDESRPGLIRLLVDARRGLFQVVLIADRSRLSRSVEQFERHEDWLREAGVRVLSASGTEEAA